MESLGVRMARKILSDLGLDLTEERIRSITASWYFGGIPPGKVTVIDHWPPFEGDNGPELRLGQINWIMNESIKRIIAKGAIVELDRDHLMTVGGVIYTFSGSLIGYLTDEGKTGSTKLNRTEPIVELDRQKTAAEMQDKKEKIIASCLATKAMGLLTLDDVNKESMAQQSMVDLFGQPHWYKDLRKLWMELIRQIQFDQGKPPEQITADVVLSAEAVKIFENIRLLGKQLIQRK